MSEKKIQKNMINELFKSNAAHNLENLLLPDFHDVTFIVGNHLTGIKKIKANRTIFALQCSVFRAQLYGSFAETKSNNIIIDDVNPWAFEYIKNAFYGTTVPLQVEYILDVLQASIKYMLTDLESQCYLFIENIISLKDWWFLIKNAEKTENTVDALITKNNTFIENLNAIAKDQIQLNTLHYDWIIELIKSNQFSIEEHNIWQICLRYATNYIYERSKNTITNEQIQTKNSIQCMMLDFSKYIRFSLMNRKFFFENIVNAKILDNSILFEICKCFVDNPNQYPYLYQSQLGTWKPRVPYDRFLLSIYDIKSMKSGDEIMVQLIDGQYAKCVIKAIQWTEETKNVLKYIKFVDDNQIYYQNKDVHTLSSQGWLMRVNTNNWNLADYICKTPYTNVIKQWININIYDLVEFSTQRFTWHLGKVIGIDNEHGTFWHYYKVKRIYDNKNNTYGPIHKIHVWDFENIRRYYKGK